MQPIRSILFWFFINAWGAVIPIIYFPVFITNSRDLADRGALTWARFALWVLKKVCKIDHEIKGLEKLPKNESFIVACKHQSMWDTIVMNLIFDRPAYVFKKELLNIPFYGWFLRRMTGIAVDRDGGATALKSLVKQTNYYLENKTTVVIFPQGTRVPVNGSLAQYPYQPGIAALYKSCGVKVVPAALNSGVFWGRHKAVKNPGTITLEFLDPINPDLKREDFMAQLETTIEKRSSELAKIALEKQS